MILGTYTVLVQDLPIGPVAAALAFFVWHVIDATALVLNAILLVFVFHVKIIVIDLHHSFFFVIIIVLVIAVVLNEVCPIAVL